ncbi:MAG: hypothetical protein P8I82_01905 [Flavobacteriales bacterium]|jgi:hypothetical protein|nr:hypothetical protein [Flavobacteriales bacterium]
MKNKIILFLLSIFFISINNQAQDLDSLLTRGNKVFISSENKGVIKYSKEKIILWNYWKIVEDVNEADIILHLDATWSGVYKIASYITTKDDKIIKRFRTDAWNNFWSGAKFNVKKGSVFGLFEQEIIPYVHSLE